MSYNCRDEDSDQKEEKLFAQFTSWNLMRSKIFKKR